MEGTPKEFRRGEGGADVVGEGEGGGGGGEGVVDESFEGHGGLLCIYDTLKRELR
jgi:hypothetical protein